MKPEVQEIWADALESGEYTQGFEYLRPNNCSHCALGVLVQEYFNRCENPEFHWGTCSENPEAFAIYNKDLELNSFGIPHAIREWAGLLYSDPIVSHPDAIVKHISCINDRQKLSFPKIAKLIREGKIT